MLNDQMLPVSLAQNGQAHRMTAANREGVRQNSLICIKFAHCRAVRDILKPWGITGM
jgi:hypothetical protein